jgi:hypothetical protein
MVFVSTGTAALMARGYHAAQIAAAANGALAALRDSELAADHVDAELRRTTADLDRIDQFAAARGRLTTLLGAISEALPDSTAVVSLRLDTLDATFMVLAPHAADVLPSLLDLRSVAAPRIVGAVTREVQAGVRLERASFRFRR